jgi:hypothetical protein
MLRCRFLRVRSSQAEASIRGQWNAATQAAVTAWNAAHPGYVADGSQQGWHLASANPQPITNWSDPGAAAAKTALLGQQQAHSRAIRAVVRLASYGQPVSPIRP